MSTNDNQQAVVDKAVEFFSFMTCLEAEYVSTVETEEASSKHEEQLDLFAK